MKLRVITKDASGRNANLKLKKEDKFYLNGEEFETTDERGKELLGTTWEGNSIVEEVVEVPKSRNKSNIEETNKED